MAHTNLVLGDNWLRGEWPESVDVMHEGAVASLKYVPERICKMQRTFSEPVRMVCKGERGEVEIKQCQRIDYVVNSEHEHWDVAAYVGEDLALELEINPYGGMQKAAYIIDMMCEYVGCARKTEAML